MADATYRTAATDAAMRVLARFERPLTRAEINEKCGEISEASERSHKPAGEVNDAEYAGRIVRGRFFTRPARGLYSSLPVPDGADQDACAQIAAEIRSGARLPDGSIAPDGDGEDASAS